MAKSKTGGGFFGAVGWPYMTRTTFRQLGNGRFHLLDFSRNKNYQMSSRHVVVGHHGLMQPAINLAAAKLCLEMGHCQEKRMFCH
ncbi:MAG: hypothetical protein AB2693_30600 [Candidatus Thiodiazotropha sp.]